MSRVRISPFALGFFCIIVILLFAPVVINMISVGNDAPANIRYAADWQQSGFFGRPRPHFLFQVLIIFLSRFIPGSNSLVLAAGLVGIVSYLFFGLAIYMLVSPLLNRLSPRSRSIATIALALALMLVAPINLLTLNQHKLYLGYIGIHSYHNPPMNLMKPFALLLFLLCLRVFSRTRASPFLILTAAAIAFLGTIAKPSYVICLLPALTLITLIALVRKQSIDWRLLLIGIVLPLGLVLFWQSRYHSAANMGGFIIAPLQVMSAYSNNLLLKLMLSILFPALVFLLYWPASLKDRSLQLSWLTFGVAAAYTYLLSETEGWTVSATDGNFGWSAEIALLILFIFSALFFIQQYLSDRRWTPKFGICTAAFALHLISGIIFYAVHLGSAWNGWL